MSEAPGDASVAPVVSRDDIERLSALYDGFVNAFDPFAAARDAAEEAFNREVAICFDMACFQDQQIGQLGIATTSD